MTALQTEIVQDLAYIENDLGNPMLNIGGTNYPCTASITSFTRQLETGGSEKVQMLTATVRILNPDGTTQLAAPMSKSLITYSVGGLSYRIDTIKLDPTGTHFRIIAIGTARGI